MRITALIVSYQQRRFVEDAIRSVLAQTRAADEIVLIDDGSTDGTPEAAEKVGAGAVRVISGEHRGITRLADTYNAGLAVASGELISILEADDRWLPEKLATHAAVMSDPTIVLAHGPYAVIGAQGTRLRDRVDPIVRLPRGAYEALPKLLLGSYVMPVTTTFRRSALEQVGGFTQLGATPHIDYPTTLALAGTGRFFKVEAVLAEWRKHGGSGTTTLAGVDLEGAALCALLAIDARRRHGESGLPSRAEIERAWRAAQGRQIWSAARLLLKAGRHHDARTLLRQARLRDYPLALGARLLAARFAALTGTDVEALARLRTGGASVFDELD